MMYPFVMVVLAVFGPVGNMAEYDTREEHMYFGTMAACERAMKAKEQELMETPNFRGGTIECRSR